MTTGHGSMFDFVNEYFDHAAGFTKHPKGLLEQIKGVNTVVKFEFPIRRDDAMTYSREREQLVINLLFTVKV